MPPGRAGRGERVGRSGGRMVMVEEVKPTLAQLLARLGLNKYQEVALQTTLKHKNIAGFPAK